MRTDIHPDYKAINVTCSCGNKFETRSTNKNSELHIEICSQCHPFYTGQQKIVDTAGRVDRFRQKYGRAKKAAPAKPQEDAK
jgi:large subunit ribosomal protein L31